MINRALIFSSSLSVTGLEFSVAMHRQFGQVTDLPATCREMADPAAISFIFHVSEVEWRKSLALRFSDMPDEKGELPERCSSRKKLWKQKEGRAVSPVGNRFCLKADIQSEDMSMGDIQLEEIKNSGVFR